MDINYQYSKLRNSFGRQPLFCEQGPEVCCTVLCDPALHRHFMLRNPVHQPTQNTPLFSQCYINTIRAEYATTGSEHAEGGWPRDVQVKDIEQTQRYRRKVEKEDGYIHCVQSNAPGIEYYVMQNNAIELYKTYFSEIAPVAGAETVSCRTVNVYRDAESPRRPIVSICWQPDGGHRFAAAYANMNFGRTPLASLHCYVWDVENPRGPVVTLKPPGAVMDLQYNARDPSILAGGLVGGQVCAWDLRLGPKPFVACPPHVAHRDLVRKVMFVNAKSGREFFSTGPDGVCKWWDLRRMHETVEEMILDVVKMSTEEPFMKRAYGASVLEFEPTIPTRFMVGTENGLILCGNRKGKTALEKLPVKFEAHLGPIRSLERNPGFLKNFLTVGDWTVRVWSEECRESAILWSPPMRQTVTAGTWSPTRVSALLLTHWDGTLAVWDLLRRQHVPMVTVHVCNEPLLHVRVHEQGSLVACGSKKGDVYLVELSRALVETDKHDKGLLTVALERETKRERILETRMREIKLKQRQEAEGGGSVHSSSSDLAAAGDRDLAEATNDYLQQVKKELQSM